MAEVSIVVYLALLALVIISPIMARVAKDSWKSWLWTSIFVMTGVTSMISLIVIFIFL